MRAWIRLIACALALVVVAGASAVTATRQFRGSLTATTHSPVVSQRWTYYVGARSLKGKPLKASAHVQVFERGKRVNIIGWHQFKGSYKQTIRWATSTRGHRYVFQTLLIATGANGKKSQLKLNYTVTPK